jgi:hypothetical protein
MSLLFDLCIYVGTLCKVVGLSMATICRLCWFVSRDVVDDAYLERVDAAKKENHETLAAS